MKRVFFCKKQENSAGTLYMVTIQIHLFPPLFLLSSAIRCFLPDLLHDARGENRRKKRFCDDFFGFSKVSRRENGFFIVLRRKIHRRLPLSLKIFARDAEIPFPAAISWKCCAEICPVSPLYRSMTAYLNQLAAQRKKIAKFSPWNISFFEKNVAKPMDFRNLSVPHRPSTHCSLLLHQLDDSGSERKISKRAASTWSDEAFLHLWSDKTPQIQKNYQSLRESQRAALRLVIQNGCRTDHLNCPWIVTKVKKSR